MLSELQIEVTLPDQPEHLAVSAVCTRFSVPWPLPPACHQLSQQMEVHQLHTLALGDWHGIPVFVSSTHRTREDLGRQQATCVCARLLSYLQLHQSTHEAVLRIEKWGAKQMTGPVLHRWAVRGNS